MIMTAKVTFKLATLADVPELLDMYHQSFRPLFDRYHDEQSSPYLETPASLITKMQRPGSQVYFVMVAKVKVGMIRVIADEAQRQGRVSPFLILPAYQHQGFALAALAQLEVQLPMITKWSVDTIEQVAGLVRLYQRAGFHLIPQQKTVIQPGMTIVYFEKPWH